VKVEDFNKYHFDNPEIYQAFEKFTFEAIRSGRTHFSSEMVINRLRWYTQIEARNDQFKINNNYKAFYSRLFEDLHPEHKGFFNKRTSIADSVVNA